MREPQPKKYVSTEGKAVSTEQKQHLRAEREYKKGAIDGPDLYGRPRGDPHYGEDDFTAAGMPNFSKGVELAPEVFEKEPVLRNEFGKKVPKIDWERLVQDGFTNELGSPQEAWAVVDLVKKAPVATLLSFINKMDDDHRYTYLTPVGRILRQRLRGTDLVLHEDYSIGKPQWRRDLGEALLGGEL